MIKSIHLQGFVAYGNMTEGWHVCNVTLWTHLSQIKIQ